MRSGRFLAVLAVCFMFSFLGSALAQDVANVYFYRISGYTAWDLKPSIYINGDRVGRVGNDRYFVVKVKPGTYRFHSDRRNVPSVTVEAGKSYYFRAGVSQWGNRFHLTEVAPDQGNDDIKQLELDSPDHVYHETYPYTEKVSRVPLDK